MIGVFRIDRAEDVELRLVFLEHPGSTHDTLKGSMPPFVFPALHGYPRVGASWEGFAVLRLIFFSSITAAGTELNANSAKPPK
jgi:hypothetical protein